MKVKLKKGQRLSSMDNYSGLCYKDWLALEQGKVVELDKINNFIKEKVETVGAKKIKKQPILKEEE